ncbi:hypothetical protein G7046_g2830 [Stylonectria norvegica]|nr:hypothetical protein G7046_g2830 [Stylonectria norvegica]
MGGIGNCLWINGKSKTVDFPLISKGYPGIRADAFRPLSASKESPVPALLAWSPYGKDGNGFQSLDKVPFRAGVPKDWTSDLEKFEAPDPAEWCARGYAIVNVDPRGVGDSDGDIFAFGTQSVEIEDQLSSTQYRSDSWDDDGAHFTYTFSQYTELVGFSKAILYMSCTSTDDMDVYVVIRKLDARGQALLHMNVPLLDLPPGTKESDIPNVNIFKYVGPNGRLRASHRRSVLQNPELSSEQSKVLFPGNIWRLHDAEEKITPGDIVCLEIPLWPSGMILQAGEAIRLEVKGHEVTLPEFPALDRVPTNLNSGMHVIYSGKDYPSSLILPLSQGSGLV